MAVAFERAVSLYQEGRFEPCREAYVEIFENERATQLAQDDPAQLPRVYYSACLLALGRYDPAAEQLRKALRKTPLMPSPDPVVFPSQVRDLFFTVKSDFLEAIRLAQEAKLAAAEKATQLKLAEARRERQRVARLETLAKQETLVHRNRRWIASLPFGVGQFQNGQTTLGVAFLVTETLFLGGLVGAVSVQLNTHAEAKGGRDIQDPEEFNRILDAAHGVELFSAAGLLLTGGLGILEANLNFRSEQPVGTRAREEEEDDIAVTLSPQPLLGGGGLSLRGAF